MSLVEGLYPANFVLNRVIRKVILFLHASVASRTFISSQLRSEPCHSLLRYILRVGVSWFVCKKNSLDSVRFVFFVCVIKMQNRKEHILPFYYRKVKNIVQARKELREVCESVLTVEVDKDKIKTNRSKPTKIEFDCS